jgi:hypothetical protein
VALDLAIVELMTGVTKKWAKQRKAEERSKRAVANRRDLFTRARWTIKEAAYEVMETAYPGSTEADHLTA